MSFTKSAERRANSVVALNVPDWPEYNLTWIKTAAVEKAQPDLGGYDITAAIQEHPDNLFIKIFAIKKDEVNDNGDAFGEAELLKAYSSFVGVPVFCNHQNNDVEKARGKVVHSWYDQEKGGIWIVARVDRVAYPKLARGIEEGYITGTSMGCSVEYSVCSVCHNRAAIADQYCEHVRERKNKKFSGVIECQYHRSPDEPLDDCPLCGCKKGETKKLSHAQTLTFEHNFDIKFIENSFVVNPACHECGVEEIFNISGLNKKIASLKETLTRISDVACSSGACKLRKVAGKQEVDLLTAAMDNIERVAKSMMTQKQHISMEYVSDLVKTLADVQGITDELVEMGYTQLPSPPITGEEDIELPKTSEEVDVTPEAAPTAPVPAEVPPVGPAGITTEDAGGVGTVTKPKFSSENLDGKKKEFITASDNLIQKLTLLQNSITAQTSAGDAQSATEKQIASEKESETMTTENTDTVKVGQEQEKVEKVAEHDTEVITERQLDDAKFTGERAGSPDVITEKQLFDPKDVNVTTSETPQERKGSYDVITEKQLDAVKSGIVVRWGDFPDVITEKQWTDMSRLIGSVLTQDQDNIITEKQLLDFMSHHGYTDPGVITEKQLNKATTVPTKRWAAADVAGLVKAAENIVADTVAYFRKTPDEIKKAVSYFYRNPMNLEKAAFLTIINSMPHKAEDRRAHKARYTYLAKLAQEEVEGPNVLDALIISMSDNLADYGADDLLDALKHVASNKKAIAQVEHLVQQKMASGLGEDNTMDKTAAFDQAIDELDRPEDGTYEINVTVAEVGQDPTEKKEFLDALHKLADKLIDDKDIKTAITKVDLDDKAGTVTAVLKDVNALTDDEKKALSALEEADEEPVVADKEYNQRKEARENIVKEAQLFGGEMGGQGGAAQAPGAGASLPQPPNAVGQPPIESFEQSDLGDVGGLEDEGLQPKPPGTSCVVCGSDDVDIIGGKGKCNNCGSDQEFEVIVRVPNWAGFLEGDKDGAVEDEGALEAEETVEEEGAGFKMPEAGEPMAAGASTDNDKVVKEAEKENYQFEKFAVTVLLKPDAVKKLAEKEIKLGSVSPLTGSTDTIQLDNGKRVCLDTGSEYTVQYAVSKKDPKKVYARWIWAPKSANADCEDCSRAKAAFVKALEAMGTNEQEFDALDLKAKGEAILAMRKAGHLKAVKTASQKEGTRLENYKTAFSTLGDKFPIESCRERLARRYGENALALSGPCEGQPLHECVCKSLKQAGVYSNHIAVKVAEVWRDKEGSVECMEDFVRMGYELKEAATICDTMKMKYAQFDDEFAAGLEETVDDNLDQVGEVDGVEDVSPFEDIDEETVTLEIPVEVVEKLDAALDTALGEGVVEEAPVEGVVEEGVVDEGVVDEGVVDEGVVDEEKDIGPLAGAALEVGKGVAEKATQTVGDVVSTMEGAEGCEGGPVKPLEGDVGVVEVVAVEDDEIGDEAACDELAKKVLSGEVPVDVALDQVGEDKQDDLLEAILKVKKGENIEGVETEGVEEVTEDANEVADEGETFKEGSDEEEVVEEVEDTEDKDMAYAQTEEELVVEAERMKRGRIGHTGEIGLDLSSVLEAINPKEAQVGPGEKELRHQNAQDTPDLGKVKDKQNIGDEDAFTEDVASKPDVPSANATMGKEPKDLNPSTDPKVKVPVGSKPMGHEELEGGDDRYTGGDVGQGSSRAASTKDRLSALAERILDAQENMEKEADEKKVKRQPPQDDEDIKPYSEGDSAFMGKEKESIESVPAPEIKPSQVPTTDSGFIGNEKESIGDKPTEKDTPEIPAKDDRIKGEKDNEKIAPEKEERVEGVTGTGQGGVIASSDEESTVQKASDEAAYKLAGRMLQSGMIEVGQLANKVAELSKYEPAQLNDLEKGMFAGQKGLNTPPDGIEQPVVIGEVSSEKDAQKRNEYLMKTAQEELKDKLLGIFSLSHRNALAEQDSDTQLRKTYGR